MRIVYLGTPDFSVLPLQKIVEAGYKVVGVVTNKDKPVGRKHVLTPPPVKVFSQKLNIPVFQYDKIRVEGVEDIKKLKPELMITCAFGQILSQEILDIPKLGVINIHASLLPLYRGASPIHYAILNGEKQTGITIMKTDVGIDTGDIILQRKLEIKPTETCGELFDRLSVLASECIIDALKEIENGRAIYKKQDDNLATFTKIIKKEIAQINWNDDAKSIYNKIRAFNPSPVAFCLFENNPFKIYSAKICDMNGKAGTILKADKELVIACGKGALKLLTVQKAGGKQMDAQAFLLGNKLTVGGEFK